MPGVHCILQLYKVMLVLQSLNTNASAHIQEHFKNNMQIFDAFSFDVRNKCKLKIKKGENIYMCSSVQYNMCK